MSNFFIILFLSITTAFAAGESDRPQKVYSIEDFDHFIEAFQDLFQLGHWMIGV